MMTGIFELYRITASSSGTPEYPVVPAMSGIPESYGDWHNANGLYKIYDASQTGTNRIWKHETGEFYVRYVYGMWVLVTSPTSTSYSLYISNYNGSYPAPYDEVTGESYTWTYQGSANSSITFELETYGNTNFFLKDPSDKSMMYAGIYVQQKKKGIDYMAPCSDGQLWIQNPAFEPSEANKNTRCALWCDGTSYIIGTVQVDSSGNVTEKTPKYTVAGNGTWPWKMIGQFGDGSLSIKKTKDNSLIIPQGIEIQNYDYPAENIVGKYPYRSVSGNVFPVEGDVFYMYDGSGSKVICYKDSYSNQLRWGIRQNDSTNDSYYADAEWSWPNKCKFGQAHGGSANIPIVAIGTGETNIRILPIDNQTDTFSDFGVYRRLSEFQNNGYNITFDYSNPVVQRDKVDGNNIHSYAKVWIKASEYDSFMASAPMGEDSFNAIIMMSPGESNIELVDSVTNSDDSPYASNYYCFGTVVKGVGTTYLTVTSIKGFFYAPKMLWPWELDSSFYKNTNIARTDFETDPPAPPIALYASGFQDRSNGYYANRVINNEYTPTHNDRWRICGLDDSSKRYVDSIWYNGNKRRWEMYFQYGDSHQYAYSSATTEKWPDDADLLWYWGDRGYISGGTLNEAASVVRRTDEPISRQLVVKGLVFQSVSPTYYYGQVAYSLSNSFNYKERTPELGDDFAIISTHDNPYRGTVVLAHDDSGYYWQLGTYAGNEYESSMIKGVYCPPVATLAEVKWPWEIAEWACTHPGGWGTIQNAPLAFGVSDDSSVTQAVGSYNSQIASGNAGYSGANTVWTCTTRDINVENLGMPTYYDRFISADGRAVVFLNADVGNIDNGCRWVMRFPLYDESGTAEDQYQRYYAAYRSASMDQRSPKWPWEVAWETPNTSYWPNPAPSFVKGNGATGGLYWGDRVFVKAKNSADSYELPFLGGKQLPNLLYGQYAYAITYDGQNDSINPVFNGEFYLAPELLTWENFKGYDVAYRSKKDDKLGYYQPPNGGSSIAFGENGAFGAIVGKYNKADDNWTWTFVYFSRTGGGINSMPKYQYTGGVPIGGEVWECVDWVTIGVPQDVHVFKVDSAKLQAAAAPNLVPKASDFWEGTIDGNAWSISWNSTTKHYEAAVLGASFESNAIAVDESGNPKLFPWELTEEQWGAEFSANVEIGIEGSRFEITGSDITGGYNESYKRNTPANGLYFSRKFGGKFANSALAGENYDTYYIRRQTGTNSTDFREQGSLKFITEHEGGPQWRLATNPNSDKYVFALVQRGDDWRSPYADYASLKPPYDFENMFYSWYGNGYFGKIVPWSGYVIANGQRDYKTIPMFGARFNTKFKVDGVEETIAFTYSDDFEPLGDAPTAKSLWKGSKATSTAPIHFSWFWDSDNKCWILRITHMGDTTDITSVSGDSAEPSFFPWEYKAYEFSNWSPGIVAGYMISGFEWQGSRIVISGISQYSGNGGHDVNGSYVSLHADPENYAYDSTNKNWCWFNKFGCRFGRWNGSTGWALNSRDATFFSVSATNSSKLPWKDEDFSSDSSYSYGPSNFLVNGRAQDNPTGFTSAVDVIKCDADLKGRYVLVGYRTITADGGFEELVYRKADNGCRLIWDGSKWTLYGSDQTDWYTASSSDQLRYPQDQALTWEVGIAGEGSAANLPLIVAVPGEAKLPKANRTVLTVAGAGTAEANGTYNPVDGVDAFGSSMTWLKSDGTYKIWCNAIAVANWLIGKADSITGEYLLLDPPAANGAIEGPYAEDGSSKTWEVIAEGTAPAPTVTAVIVKNVLTVSGCSSPAEINGEYELVDDTAEGDNRIWKHTSANYWVARGISYRTWMVSGASERPYDPGSSSVYFYGSDTSKANPYNDDGTSYSWNAIRGSGTLSIIKG